MTTITQGGANGAPRRKTRNSMNFVQLRHHSERHNNMASKTIPGESMTVRELLQHHAQGELIRGTKEPIYDSPETHDEIDETRIPGFDLIDALDLKEEISRNQIQLAEEKQIAEQQKTEEATPPSRDKGETDLQVGETKKIGETAIAEQQKPDEKK